MADKTLFASLAGKLLPAVDAVNSHGAPAYALSSKQKLAQYAMTGCLNRTFYASGADQLKAVLDLAYQTDARFVADLAVYARKHGHMKDMPALLCAVLSFMDGALLKQVFPQVIDNGKMLRNFVQIMRSGVVGRKSLGSLPKGLVIKWLESASDAAMLDAATGNAPSLADVLKMVHPKPASPAREAFYGYVLGKPHKAEALPEAVRTYVAYKAYKAGAESAAPAGAGGLPKVPFQWLTSLDLGTQEWMEVARNAGWQMTRMNLNTFARHGVFKDKGMVKLVAARLRNAEAVAKVRVFPYQLLAAFASADDGVPEAIREALQDAMELAIGNVPAIDGQVYVCPDVSGSMASPVTGHRKGSTTAVRCIDVAALVAAAVLRKNKDAVMLPFEQDVVKFRLNPRDSVLSNAKKLASIGGGGTNCSAPLAKLNKEKALGDLVVFISDNESWVDAGRNRGTATMAEWAVFKGRNPNAKLACIDIQPNGTAQAKEREDILNVGGFSDQVFSVIAEFAAGRLGDDHWVEKIQGAMG
jgi:60 kDa SS-A/Ro ribonucleoprotein